MAMDWGSVIQAGAQLLGQRMNRAHDRKMARRAEAFQREFAQHGIQWRVEDAEAAGLHPLYALGAPTFSPAPINYGEGPGAAIAAAGQHLGRAISATETSDQRLMREMAIKKAQLDLDRGDLQNQVLQEQLNGLRRAGPPMAGVRAPGEDIGVEGQVAPLPLVQVPHGVEIPGQFDVSQAEPSKSTSARSRQPNVAAGEMAPGSKEYRLTRNMAVLLPAANDLGEALEPLSESVALMWAWYKINKEHYGPSFDKLLWQEFGVRWPDFVSGFGGSGTRATQRSWVEELNRRGRMISPERR